jgi:protein TonB
VCGNGAVEAGEDCDDGNTRDGDGCTAACRREPQPTTKFVIPSVLQGLRTSGETQISPDTSTQNRMLRDGVTHTSGSVKVCIATDGSVASVKLLASTRYGGYDAMLLAAVRDWRYRPYMLGGTPVPACSVVTFNYTIK